MTDTTKTGNATPAPARAPWIGTFVGLVSALLCTFTAIGMVIPVIPRLVTRELGGSAFEVGVTFAVSGVTALLVRPYAGRLAQRHGCRKVMLLGALIIVAVAGVYALPLGLGGLWAARFLLGLGEALLFMAGSLWTVGLAPQDRRAQIVGFYGLAMWTGFAVGPLVGEFVYRTGSFTAVWITVAVLPAVAFAVVCFLTDRIERGAQVSAKLLPRAAVLPGVSLLCGSFGYGVLVSFGALAMTARDIADGSVLVSAFGAAYVTVRVLAGRIPDRLGAVPVVIFSAVVEAVGLALIAFAPSLWLAALGALIAGGGFTLLYPALALITIDAAPEAERGAALGAVTSFFDVGLGLAGLLGGVLAEFSYTAVLVAASVTVLGSLLAGTTAARGSAPR
jgi:MFS family permease